MCEHCSNWFKEIEAEEQDGGCMSIACNAPGLIVEISRTETLTFNINFCPMCGRNLKEKNK